MFNIWYTKVVLIGNAYGTIKKQYFTNVGPEPMMKTGIGRGLPVLMKKGKAEDEIWYMILTRLSTGEELILKNIPYIRKSHPNVDCRQ